MPYVVAGTRVIIRPIKHIRERLAIRTEIKPFEGIILDDGRIGECAGWDVFDIRKPNGKQTFAYGFEIEKSGR